MNFIKKIYYSYKFNKLSEKRNSIYLELNNILISIDNIIYALKLDNNLDINSTLIDLNKKRLNLLSQLLKIELDRKNFAMKVI